MTTPTGQISLNDVNVELGLAGTTLISMNQTNVRTLAGVPSGAISMQNLQGKSNRVSISHTFSANTANASLNLSAISGYISGKSDITVTINTGVYLYSTSTGGYGLNLSGGTTGDTLTIVNNGSIMGQGGNGGYSSGAGASGGTALNLGFGMSSCTINNTNASAYIAGGGGGGGGALYGQSSGGGGGAGGGNGGGSQYGGGGGGGIGASGSNGAGYGGGGGGRILPGTGGAQSSASKNNGTYGYGGGAGGSGGCFSSSSSSIGGAGGSGTSAGATKSTGGGGGWGAAGGAGENGNVAGGSGGKAVNLNSKSITWTSGNTTRVYGAVS